MTRRSAARLAASVAVVVALVVNVPASPASAFAGGATRISPAGVLWLVRGIDRVDRRLFVEDVTNHYLRESDDWGATFSGNRGLPAGVTSVGKVLRFGPRLFMVGRDPTTGLVGVYSAMPTPLNVPLQWSGPSITIAPPATVLQTDFNSDSRYLYLGEYGDPKPGPELFRSPDGVHWQMVFASAAMRHIHAVAGDPYRPGDVWMTVGDGVARSIWRSTSYGAPGSWRAVVKSAAWQSVQISFSRSRIYLASDASGSSTFFILNRRTLKPALGTRQRFQLIHPPGSPPGTRYLFNAFFGAVDPSTGVYYCVADDESGSGNPLGGTWQGMFGVRRIGGPVQVLHPGGVGISLNGEVFVGGGRVWSGQWSLPALH
jgi:hypothetical protein